jgi:hypothetical protein
MAAVGKLNLDFHLIARTNESLELSLQNLVYRHIIKRPTNSVRAWKWRKSSGLYLTNLTLSESVIVEIMQTNIPLQVLTTNLQFLLASPYRLMSDEVFFSELLANIICLSNTR